VTPDDDAALLAARTSAVPGDEDAVAKTEMALPRMPEPALGEVKLSLTQYRLLGYLLQGGTIQSDLAFQLSVTKQSVTRVVDSLVARGLVTRRTDPGDGRRVIHRITAKGRRLHHDANQRIELFYYHTVLRDLSQRDRALVERGTDITRRALESARGRIPALPPGKRVGEPQARDTPHD